MDDSDNLVGKKSSDTSTDYHYNPISGDEKESQEDLGTPKDNSSENEGSPQGNSSDRNENKKSKKDKGPDVIVILKMNILELFVDQIGDAYAAVKIKDHIEAIPINSSRFGDWIIKTCYDYEKQLQSNDFENERAIRILGNEEAAKYQTIIKLEAEEQYNERRLEIRVAGNVDPNVLDDGNEIYYDLCNKTGEIVRITRNGWEIIKHGCQAGEGQPSRIIVFKHYCNQLPQVMPSKEYSEDISAQFLDLINIPADDIENRILAEVYYISLYFPSSVPKPILVAHGEQGSAKSTLQEFIKELVDPCGALTLSFPKNDETLVQQLSHNYVAYYDNISNLDQWTSDNLCRAVTGSGLSKRRLYTDDEDVIYRFRRCVGINGINIAATKPDLLERALILHLKRISKDKRRPIVQIRKQFEIIKPQLLGFIFDAISKVLNRLNDIPLTDLPRMADWAQLGEVISRCLGYPEGAFLKAYQNNLAKQNQHALEASQVAQAIIRLMQKRTSDGFGLSPRLGGISFFNGSMTELRKELNQIAENDLDINIKDKIRWPQSSQGLGNKLNEAKTNLLEVGIMIERPENKSNHSKDIILIKQDVSTGEPGNSTLESFPASSPSENGQIHAQFEHKRETGELGDFSLSAEEKNDNEEGTPVPLEVLASSPTFPSSSSDENHAQIASDINGKLDGEVEARANSCSPLRDISSVDMEHEAVELNSITDFFYDDPTVPYAPLPDHDLEQSPCYPMIAKMQGYFYCRLHSEIKNVYLESIEHHIKYKDPKGHESELLKMSKPTHN